MTDKNPVDLWLEALRSGKYIQAKAALHKRTLLVNDGFRDRFCCLGVACHLYQTEGPGDLEEGINSYNEISYDHNSGSLPKKVRNWLNLYNECGTFSDSNNSNSLAGMNDTGASFEEIADKIEERPRGLFDE